MIESMWKYLSLKDTWNPSPLASQHVSSISKKGKSNNILCFQEFQELFE